MDRRTLSYAAWLAVLLGAGSAAAEDAKPAAPAPGATAIKPVIVIAKPAAAVPQKVLQAKVAYCKTCHGVSAQGFRATVPIPRLAGQQPEYIVNQLTAFIEHRRVNPFMGNVARVLTPEMVKALSVQFQDLHPESLEGVESKSLAAEGKKIFEEGVDTAEIPPCSACHGDDAKGAGEFPRLAGQLDDYVVEQLTNWSKRRGQDPAKPDNSAIMAPIAEKLKPQQIAAVAAYVSSLK
jgi:cytochrome c553